MTSLTSPPTLKEVALKTFGGGRFTLQQAIVGCRVEQFDFGHLSQATLINGSDNAKVFISANAMKHTHQTCLYRFILADVGLAIFADTRVGGPFMAPDVGQQYKDPAVLTLMFRDNDTGKVMCNTGALVSFEDRVLACESISVGKEQISSNTLASYYLALLGLLHTKSISTVRTKPCTKQNAARAKAGKPLLPYVTTVDLTSYRQATEHQGGTHASPRPHLRRAHVRRIANDNGDKLIPVAAALVNWDGSPLMRTEYQVRT